jgi:hypothetical protein
MPVNVKVDYVDEVSVVEQGVRAEEKQGSLLVYDQDGTIIARFNLSKLEHWWTGTSKKMDNF